MSFFANLYKRFCVAQKLIIRGGNKLEYMSTHDANKIASLYERFAIHIVMFSQIRESDILGIKFPAYSASAIDSIYIPPPSM